MSCAGRVRATLQKLDGVKEVSVNFDTKLAQVTYDSDKIQPEDIVKGLAEGSGGRYTAEIKK